MALGTASAVEHPSLSRYLRWFRDTTDPFVVIEGWPESGRTLLMDGLARALGATDLEADPLNDSAPPGWYRWREPDDRAQSRKVTSWQRAGPGRRVFLRGSGQRATLPSTATWLSPSMLLLQHEEIQHWLDARGLGSPPLADRLAWWSGGWLGPLCRFHAAWDAPTDQLNRDWRSELASVASSVMAALPRVDRHVLSAMAVVGPVPLSAWRRSLEIPRQEGTSVAGKTTSESGGASDLGSWSVALREVIARWFPYAGPADSLGVPPVFVDGAFAHPIDGAWSPIGAEWLTALATVLDADGDAEGARRLRVLGGDASPDPRASTATQVAPSNRPVVELRLFGHARADVVTGEDQRHEVHWRLRRSFRAVAFLALAAERRASRAELVEALWPVADPDVIRKNFHPVLSDARRTLRQAVARPDVEGVVYQQGTYRLDERIDWRVDVDAFERDSSAAPRPIEASTDAAPRGIDPDRLDAWLRAWRSYRGPLLDGSDASWVTARREPLTRQYLALLRRIGMACARVGRTTEALDAYRSALLEDPYDEPIHRAVMNLYGAQGRRDLVLVQFLRLQDHLKELNVEPRAETQQCYDRLMRADPTVDDTASRS